jgi:2-haloacid dehalogenase
MHDLACPSAAPNASPPIRAVVFDAYGTLFDVHSVASLAEQLFSGRGDALSQLWRQKQLEYSWLRAMSGRYKPFWDVTRDALRHACARLGLPLDAALEARLMNQYASLSAYPENLAALRALKAAGLPLGILTNGNRDMIEVSLRSAGMVGLFDHVLSSQQVETFKTADPIYALAPEAFGCRARQILFVSSNCWDAIGARWFGFTSFWINRVGAPIDQLDTEPDFTGSLLTEVLTAAAGRMSRHLPDSDLSRKTS